MEYRLSLSLSVFADIELALKLSELTNSHPPACGVKSTSPFHIRPCCFAIALNSHRCLRDECISFSRISSNSAIRELPLSSLDIKIPRRKVIDETDHPQDAVINGLPKKLASLKQFINRMTDIASNSLRQNVTLTAADFNNRRQNLVQ